MRQKTIQMLSGDVMTVVRRCPNCAPVRSQECEAVYLFSVYSCCIFYIYDTLLCIVILIMYCRTKQ